MRIGKLGLKRIRQGHDVAFLASMPWSAMHIGRVLLASCESHVEAATLSIVLPSARIFCLKPVSPEEGNESADQEQGGKPLLIDWPQLTMRMTVQRGQPLEAEQGTSVDQWEHLHIDLDHAWPHSVPKGFDMVVIPAEGRDLLQSLDPTLLHSSQIVVSEGLMDLSHIWKESMLQQQEPSSPELHMHRSGWDIYAKQSLFSIREEQSEAGQGKGKIKIALHITAKSHYQLSLQQHLSRLIFSGLYDVAERVYCFILGPNDSEIDAAATFVQNFGQKVVIAGRNTNMSLYERFTLMGMRAHLQPEDYFLYMHTKGISHAADNIRIFDWIFYMHFFIVKHYRVCLRLMEEHFDLCGVDYLFPDPETPYIPSEHYTGNFWWARASYYLSLPESVGPEYLDPEMYVGLAKPRYAALWASHVIFYGTEYPPQRFVDSAATALTVPNHVTSGAVF